MLLYPVSTYSVAPDFYGATLFNTDYRMKPGKEFMRSVPYKPGAVVWVSFEGKQPRLAIIARFWRDMIDEERSIEKYRVHVQNKNDDAFSRRWRYATPEEIQRGYELTEMKEAA